MGTGTLESCVCMHMCMHAGWGGGCVFVDMCKEGFMSADARTENARENSSVCG